MAITREDLIPSLVENTTMQKVFVDGEHRQYAITPCEGYALHDKNLDHEVIDEDTLEPTGEVILGFYLGTTTVRYDYDFTVNPREFYAISRTDVPEGAEIFNIPSGEHEVM